MLNLGNLKQHLRRFRRNEDGNMAITFAFSAVALIGAMGAAMDYTVLSNAKNRGQAIADQIALSAAVYVKNNGGEPVPGVGTDGQNDADVVIDSRSGYLDRRHKIYNAAELGVDFKGWVEGGPENVKVELEYDSVNNEVTTRVSGKTVPTFMQILGQQDMSFSAEATAKYEFTQNFDPASVLMILDNSGSMSYDDKPVLFDTNTNRWVYQPETERRIDALKTHADSFVANLSSLVGDQSADEDKVLRTGLLAYNTDIIPARTVSMRWNTSGVESSLTNMVPTGGTNSAPPINTARSWMNLEDKEHTDVHGEDPLKFLIFMTDGVNTEGGVTWVPEEGTGQWRGQVCTWVWRGSCRRYVYDTVESEERPTEGRFWEEGSWVPVANIASAADCANMKNEGVEIYTIGFALAEGWYDTNGFHGPNTFRFTSSDIRDQAFAFLAECASDPDKFLTAENADELNQAFQRIGQSIQDQIIRLSN